MSVLMIYWWLGGPKEEVAELSDYCWISSLGFQLSLYLCNTFLTYSTLLNYVILQHRLCMLLSGYPSHFTSSFLKPELKEIWDLQAIQPNVVFALSKKPWQKPSLGCFYFLFTFSLGACRMWRLWSAKWYSYDPEGLLQPLDHSKCN